MGNSLGKKRSKIIIVGLDNSGKSTMINFLKPKKVSPYNYDIISSKPSPLSMLK